MAYLAILFIMIGIGFGVAVSGDIVLGNELISYPEWQYCYPGYCITTRDPGHGFQLLYAGGIILIISFIYGLILYKASR